MVVALGTGLVAVAQGVWIWQNRHLGAFDPDESGYIATALRFHRTLGSDPLAFPRAFASTGYGSLVPLASVPLLWLGPDEARTVLLVLPLLMVVTSVAIAGIARRLAGSGSAIVSGLIFSSIPTAVLATQTYWFGLGAAAALALALWALLASDRLANRWTYAYGAGIAAMLLSRTMTLGYLPAVLLAGAVVAGRRRSSWVGLAKAVGVVAVTALPWYLVGREAIFGYLLDYGYGREAGFFGEGGPWARLANRIDRLHIGLGLVGPVLLAGVAAGVVWELWRQRASLGDLWGHRPPATRGYAAVLVAFGVGMAVLVTTTNTGVWFELPMVAILIPLAVVPASRLPRPVIAVGLVPIAAVGVLQLACSLWLVSPTAEVPLVADGVRSAQYEFGFAEFDPRFRPERRDELTGAARDWARLSREVDRRVHAITGGGQEVVTISGSFELFNSNTFQLASELQGRTTRTNIPDTGGGRDVRAGYLTPRAPTRDGRGTAERLLVIIEHDHSVFPADERVDALHREALDAGWVVVEQVPIPLGGAVLILRHPDG